MENNFNLKEIEEMQQMANKMVDKAMINFEVLKQNANQFDAKQMEDLNKKIAEAKEQLNNSVKNLNNDLKGF